MTVVIDERLIMKCETLKKQRKIHYMNHTFHGHGSASARSLDDKSLLQNLTQFHTVYCQRQTLTWDGRVLLEEFVGTADKLLATSPYL
jgi:hypothetical protein